ncbi:MAG: peptidylprolyl isomerase [Dokdonella sp.]
MKTLQIATLIVLSAFVIGMAGCQGSGTGNAVVASLPGEQTTLETVNGVKVPTILLRKLALARKLDLSKTEDYEAALRELNDYVLLGEEADRAGYAKDVDFAADVEIARLQAVANRTVILMRTQTPIDDSLLRAEYDQQIAKLGTHEYDISQLIFKTEAEALVASGELASGKSWPLVFDSASKTAQQAKSFSGIKLAQLPDPLAAAVRETPQGEAMKVPVQTQYGWHLIHVDLIAPFKPGSFEELKEGIRLTLAGQLATDRLQKLRDEAKIELLAPAPSAAAPTAEAPPEAPPVAAAVEPTQG